MTEYDFPVEEVELPSKGVLYPADSPLASGKITLKYLTAKEEDILSNRNYIRDNTVIDKLFEALVVTPGVKIEDMLSCDIDMLFFACRILSYGNEYQFKRLHPYTGKEVIATADLSQIEPKFISDEVVSVGANEFPFTLPHSKTEVTFKLLTRGDKDAITLEAKSWSKIFPGSNYERTLLLIHTLTSVNGKRDQKTIREFVEKGYLLSMDAAKLRQEISRVSPGVRTIVDCTFEDGAVEEGVDLPITVSFFWPDTLD